MTVFKELLMILTLNNTGGSVKKHTHTHTHTHTHVYIHVHACTYTCTHVYIHVGFTLGVLTFTNLMYLMIY